MKCWRNSWMVCIWMESDFDECCWSLNVYEAWRCVFKFVFYWVFPYFQWDCYYNHCTWQWEWVREEQLKALFDCFINAFYYDDRWDVWFLEYGYSSLQIIFFIEHMEVKRPFCMSKLNEKTQNLHNWSKRWWHGNCSSMRNAFSNTLVLPSFFYIYFCMCCWVLSHLLLTSHKIVSNSLLP